jgi:hypothetical protein
MAILKTSTKTKLRAKAVKQAAKNPRLLKYVVKFVKPVAKRRARKRAERVGEAARSIATTVATYAPYVAQASASLAPPPKRKRFAPRLGAAVLGTGAVLGAAAAYFLGPADARKKFRHLFR